MLQKAQDRVGMAVMAETEAPAQTRSSLGNPAGHRTAGMI